MPFSRQTYSQEERNRLKKRIDELEKENERLREMLDGKVQKIEKKSKEETSDNPLEEMLC